MATNIPSLPSTGSGIPPLPVTRKVSLPILPHTRKLSGIPQAPIPTPAPPKKDETKESIMLDFVCQYFAEMYVALKKTVLPKFELDPQSAALLNEFIVTLQSRTRIDPQCFVVALIYMERLRRIEGFSIAERSLKSILAVAVVFASKYYEDKYYSNQEYVSRLGLMTLSVYNEFERIILKSLDYNIHVSGTFYRRFLEESCRRFQGFEVRHD